MFTQQDTILVYLSPHLDDAVFSCGGMIWEQIKQGYQVEVWTFSTMDPDMQALTPYARKLHSRWNDNEAPYRLRKEEDKKALSYLGCNWRHLDYPDCIYRLDRETGESLIQKDEDLFPIDFVPDKLLVYNMTRSLEANLVYADRQSMLNGIFMQKSQLIVPLAAGGHIDHLNTRHAALQLGIPLYYYADFPYAAKNPDLVAALLPFKASAQKFDISNEGIIAWQNAVACYQSQLSSFWSSLDEMKLALSNYAALPIAKTLWKPHLTIRRTNGKTRYIN